MLKLSDNPPAVAPALRLLSDAPGPWWVAHTKARFEKAFAADLLARDIAYFLPMVQRAAVSGGRLRRVMVPLFPSYVFFSGGAEDRQRALATGRLCQVLRVVDQQRLIAEMTQVRDALENGAPLDAYPHAAIGTRCRVVAGPFRGLEGVVVRRDGRTRIVLQVALLGRGAAMEIDAALLEPAETTGDEDRQRWRSPAPLGAAG